VFFYPSIETPFAGLSLADFHFIAVLNIALRQLSPRLTVAGDLPASRELLLYFSISKEQISASRFFAQTGPEASATDFLGEEPHRDGAAQQRARGLARET